MKKNSLIDIDNAITPSEFGFSKEFDFIFKIKRVNFQNKESRDDYAIVLGMIIENSENILFDRLESFIKGIIVNPKVGDKYKARGKIVYQKDYGYQIKLVTLPKLIFPSTKEEAIKFITNNIKGLGKIRAGIIYDEFKEDVWDVLSKEPDKIETIPNLKITKNFINKIKEEFSSSFIISEIIVNCNLLGIDSHFAYPLYEKYNSDAPQILLNNPYIISENDNYLFKLADKVTVERTKNTEEIVNFDTILRGDNRYKAAVKYYLFSKLVNSGSLAVKADELIQDFTSGIFLDSVGSLPKGSPENKLNKDRIESILSQLEDSELIVFSENKKGEKYIYDEKSWNSESKLIKNIKKFNKNGSIYNVESSTVNKFVKEYELSNNIKLDGKQKLAIDLLVNNKISILTGGPGTGKTSTLKGIKDFIDYLYSEKYLNSNSISLLAPTGKASRRMSEVLGVEAQTIHRKLHLVGFGKEEEPLKIEEDFVIVDESSMIDIHLFSVLLESLGKNTNLLIVGDANQLPSVGAGLVLRDLIDSKKVQTIVLDKVFRQGKDSIIAENAAKIKDGIHYNPKNKNSIIFQKNKKNDFTLKDSYIVESSNSTRAFDNINLLLKKLINVYHIDLKDIMILTAQKKGKLGSWKINQEIQEYLRSKNKLTGDGLLRTSDNSVFYIGDPVIQLINDYENDVFNGEIGRIIDVDLLKKEIEVEFGDKVITYSANGVEQINLAYCITYHKSQGSEAPIVIQIVDESQKNMLSRSLIYTGYTRTKKTNFIVGQSSTLNQGIDNVTDLERYSLIKEKL